MDNTYSFWVFVVQLGSCELFESTWIPLEKKKDKLIIIWLFWPPTNMDQVT